ncbi:DUF421 domain-containing protein [Ruminococcus sp.]|uniref:DUF421 domain-containing protein n=1 Tax=Ruminococcus sp. TaxID=41978 RepID=UPI0025F6934D|nr:DUF421 domain-containing protein [Ruminococcus sp.]MBO4524490.1 DUF421 domain-containing protein [Ruminococcus sp.]
MCVVLIRSVMLYILVIFAVRLMGKRQLGELQPSELVITILVSNIATLPIEDINIPVIVGVTPILSLVCFEVITSWITLRFPKLRKLISGSPKIVIQNGKIKRETLRELRFSVDDLLMALRNKDVFNPDEVQFAMVETTGSISVMKKQSVETPTRSDLGITAEEIDPPVLIISDGRFIENAIESMKLSRSVVEMILSSHNIRVKDVFLMTADNSGSFFIADKKGNTPRIVRLGGEKNDKSET